MTYESWQGWVPNESGYPYLDPRGLSVNGDAGRAYGMYQFDYRYGLVPFMQSCVSYDSTYYAGFNTFISYGAGSSNLIGNATLKSLFLTYANERTEEFQKLQDQKAVTDYLELILATVLNRYHYDLREKGAVVVGFAFSIAIRDGGESGATAFANGQNKTPEQIIRDASAVMSAKYGDAGRWDTGTSISELDKALQALQTGTNIYIVPYGGEIPPHPPTPTKKSNNFWMYIDWNEGM